MKTQKNIAQEIGKSPSFISQIIKGHRRPSWKVSKRLADVTCTDPILWLEGSPEEIKAALKNQNENRVDRETLLQSFQNEEVAA